MALKFTETSIAALLAVSLAACGGSESSDPSPAPVAETPAETAAVVEEAATEVADTATDVAEVAEETASNAASDAADVVAEAADTAEDAVTEAADQVEEAVEEATDVVEEAAASGQTYEVQMLNADPDDRSKRMVFIPRVIQVQPGDTVTWVPTDPTHLAASTRGMFPEGVEGFQGRVNQPVSYTFEKPGIYGYNCTPHQAAGMVGLVVVEGEGKLDNLEAAKSVRHPGLASRIWDEIWTEAEEAGYLGG